MKKITCYCEEKFDADIPDEVNFDTHPELMASIINGDFMSVTCPKCNKVLKPEYPLKLTGTSEGIDFFFIPELDRSTYSFGKLDYETGSPARIVIGFRELVEKLKIYKEKMDDRCIEVIKYYLLQKAVDSVNNEEADIDIYFMEKKGDTLIFHIEGIKQDAIAVSQIQYEMYDKVMKDIDKKMRTDPFQTFLTPPYVSIKRVYIEK
ncbi:MAG: hypothetical protein JXJ04_26190 [Spirochaetales bacterium]|nr:hypothetical protein [Spirochaetales bacterium]